MTFLIIFSAIAALFLFYALWLRDWLKAQPAAQPFFDLVEPVEIALFRKSPTILFARLKMVSGVLLTILTQIGSIDLTPFTEFIPEERRKWATIAINSIPMILTMLGGADEWLRKKTTLPIELVEVKEATAPPEVKAAIEQVQAVKAEAVATVQAAKGP